jgi:hypothetical protein
MDGRSCGASNLRENVPREHFMSAELAVIDTAYELLREIYERTNRFPRSWRYSLGTDVIRRVDTILGELLACKYTSDVSRKHDGLTWINVELERLRFQIRLAYDVRAIHADAQRAILERVANVGKQVGGWRKSLQVRAGS